MAHHATGKRLEKDILLQSMLATYKALIHSYQKALANKSMRKKNRQGKLLWMKSIILIELTLTKKISFQ